MQINLQYVESTSEKLRRILRFHETRSTFYTENTLGKPICKPKYRVGKEDKANIVKEVDVVIEKQSTTVNLNSL